MLQLDEEGMAGQEVWRERFQWHDKKINKIKMSQSPLNFTFSKTRKNLLPPHVRTKETTWLYQFANRCC